MTLAGRSEERLAAGVGAVEAAAPGATVRSIPTDVTDEAAVQAAVEAATAVTGRLDGLVLSGRVGDHRPGHPDRHRGLAAHARPQPHRHHAGDQARARVMARQGAGSIVAISSIAGAVTHRWFSAYGPAKAGLDMLVRVAADELGASGVRVNSVRPGLTRTDLTTFMTGPGPVLDDYLSCMPLGRIRRAGGRGRAGPLLLGPEASWIAGENISVDGGHTVRRGPDLSGVLEGLFGADGLQASLPVRRQIPPERLGEPGQGARAAPPTTGAHLRCARPTPRRHRCRATSPASRSTGARRPP